MTVLKKIVRVRTGCITCRKRRTKCDEARPGCDRCRNANFRCEGYEAPRSVHTEISSPRETSQAVVKAQCLPTISSSSPRPDAFSLNMVKELPWRQKNWRSEQLPLYHHFVTSTVSRLFSADHVFFWRDRVAQMSFGVEGVYEALLAVGAVHRASLLSCSKINFQEFRRLRVQGLRAYGRALKLLAANIQGQGGGRMDMEAMLIVLLLCTYFECFMESSKAALRHLYAAIQVLRRSEPQLSPTDLMNMVPIYDVILRFDFLAMKLVPFASSSFSRCPTLAYRELPSWFRQPNDFSPSPHLDHQDRRLFPKSSTITTERHRLIQLVSGHNKLSRVVWGPWYSTSERPSRDELMSYYSDMLVWKATSPETFGSCVSDLDSQCASTVEEVDLLPIPPKPLSFTSDEAAVNMVMYNGFLGCALAMLSTTDPDPLAREIESFNSVYQNLRICSGLLYKCEGQETDEYAYKPCDCLDTGISMFLYHGTPRCFSTDWQQWTMTALHSIGREGLLNAHAFANTLEIMAQLESVSSQNVLSKNSILATKSSLGRICDRLVPVVMPKGEEGGYLAYFLRYGATEENSDESLIRIVGLANWRQDDEGGMLGLEIDSAVRGTASLDELGNMNIIEAWREKVEAGWHRLV